MSFKISFLLHKSIFANKSKIYPELLSVILSPAAWLTGESWAMKLVLLVLFINGTPRSKDSGEELVQGLS